MKKSLEIKVFGKVQGVWFRKFTRKKALELELEGFVKNMADGSVLIRAQGDETRLNHLVEWCSVGPDLAKVQRIEVSDCHTLNTNTFEIGES